MATLSRKQKTQKRHKRLRRYLNGTEKRPRLAVFRSNNHIYAQVISDEKGVTIASASSLEKDLKSDKLNRKELAEKIGQQIAKRSIQSGVKDVAFDKGKYKYHGIIKILAEAARNEGLNF